MGSLVVENFSVESRMFFFFKECRLNRTIIVPRRFSFKGLKIVSLYIMYKTTLSYEVPNTVFDYNKLDFTYAFWDTNMSSTDLKYKLLLYYGDY